MEEFAKINLYYDFYGNLLTARQQQLIEFYYGSNCSLAEIGEEMQISRQAVSDTLKRAVRTLQNYETQLGLVAKAQNRQASLQEVLKLLAQAEDKRPEIVQIIRQILDNE